MTGSGATTTYTLVTGGESSLGRVSIGGGQIVVEGIHVTASIANDGTTPTYKAAVSIASASIGGIPVTIDEDGVHVAGQGQGLPYQQASDALNGALKQAGVKLFLVTPEVTKNSCGQSGTGSGSGTSPTTTTSGQSGTPSSCGQTGSSAACGQYGTGAVGVPGTGTTTTTTTSTNQSGSPTTTSPCDQTGSAACGQYGTGSGGGPGTGTTTTTPSRNQSGSTTTTSPCDQTGSAACGQYGTSTGGNMSSTGTTTTAATTTASRNQPGTTSTTPSWCVQSGTTPTTSACLPGASTGSTTTPNAQPGASTGTTTTPGNQSSTTTTPGALDPMAPAGGSDSGEETVTATGLHVVFTQPVNQPGVPAQYVEHILGEVFVDSLAVPAPPLSNLDFSSSLSSPSFSGVSGSSSSCVPGGHSGKTTSGSGASAVGGSSAGGSAASNSLSPSGSTLGSTSQPGAGSTGTSLPAAFAAALRKPLWLLLAYVLWQAIVIATGASLWNWRRGDAS
jgi:hypothetical protein